MQTIPCDPARTYYEVRCFLGDAPTAFWLTFLWNGRDGAWYMDIADDSRNLIRGSLKIVVGSSLMGRVADPRRPAGLFVARDTSGKDLDPGISDLGARVELIFFSASEIAASLAGS